jgi:hypothetical protein
MTWRIFASLVAGGIILGAGGCADKIDEAHAHFTSCATNAYNSADGEAVRRHAPYLADNATLEQLTDPAKAAAEEIQHIYSWHPQFQACRNTLLQGLSAEDALETPLLAEAYQKSDQALADLVQQKITWGEYNQRCKEATVNEKKQYADARNAERNSRRAADADASATVNDDSQKWGDVPDFVEIDEAGITDD